LIFFSCLAKYVARCFEITDTVADHLGDSCRWADKY